MENPTNLKQQEWKPARPDIPHNDPRGLRLWVAYQLHMLGRHLTDVAAQNGVSLSTLYSAFQRSYPYAETAIAGALGLTPRDLWPERFDPNGVRLTPKACMVVWSDVLPSSPEKRKPWMKYQLKRRGLGISKLARKVGINPSALNSAFNRPYSNAERAIAGALGLEPQQLWPERFNVDGTRTRTH